MAVPRHYLCDACDEPTFCDVNLAIDTNTGEYPGVGAMLVLCNECAKTHRVAILPRE